jgi:Rad3-related DNA helicase
MIDVSARLKDVLFDEVRAAVLTSATLAVDGGFTGRTASASGKPRSCCSLALPLRGAGGPLRAEDMPEPQSPAFVEHVAEQVVRLELARPRLHALHLVRQHERVVR